MFTGIVEEIGKICDITRGRHSATLTIEANKVLEDAKIGDSIAVNGICLTVTSLPSRRFTADVMHETMNRTSMGKLRPGDRVGLERAMPVNGRFGGHIVAGHADGTGTGNNEIYRGKGLCGTGRHKPDRSQNHRKYVFHIGNTPYRGQYGFKGQTKRRYGEYRKRYCRQIYRKAY